MKSLVADNFMLRSFLPKKDDAVWNGALSEQMADFLFGTQRILSNVKFNKLYLQQDVEGEFHHCWYELPDGTPP